MELHRPRLRHEGEGNEHHEVLVGQTPTSRHFEGSAEVDGVAGYTYAVDVADNGEPGRGVDTFSIMLSNNGSGVYQAGGTLGGGNIQLHKPCL